MHVIDLDQARVAILPHVRASIEADGAIVLDLDRGAYLSLNKVAGQIWRRLADGAAPGTIASELAASCGVDEQRVRADVERFLNEVQEKGLVSIEHP